jgi:uncharacterized protein (DUF427 family)
MPATVIVGEGKVSIDRRQQTEQALTKENHMPKAIWNGTVLAESDRCETVENNCYFPPDTVKREYLKPSETHTTCPWKGEASYYDVEVGGQVNKDAAWYYPAPKAAAKQIVDHVAFWKGVTIER